MVYEGDDFEEIPDESRIQEVAREEVFKQAIRFQREWKDNMRDADYKNTGQGIDSVTIDPQQEGADEYVVGSDKVQVKVGEFGRAPGSFPNVTDLGQWVHEQTGLPDKGDPDFDNAVYNIGKSIEENGLPAYAFGRNAFRDVEGEYEERVKEQLSEE